MHQRTHTGEKPYACHLCDVRFASSGNLQDHINRHNNVKPFQCSVPECGRKFYRNSQLLKHMSNKHNIHDKPKANHKKANIRISKMEDIKKLQEQPKLPITEQT